MVEISGSRIQDQGSVGEAEALPAFELRSANEIDYWREINNVVEQLPHSRSMHTLIHQAMGIERKIREWVNGYVEAERYPGEGWSQFATQWRTVRMFVPLQLRLCTEQVLYDLGLPWRTLVSGFKPLGEAASSIQAIRK